MDKNELVRTAVRSVLTLGTVGVALYLAVVARELPAWLAAIIGGQLIDWYYSRKD